MWSNTSLNTYTTPNHTITPPSRTISRQVTKHHTRETGLSATYWIFAYYYTYIELPYTPASFPTIYTPSHLLLFLISPTLFSPNFLLLFYNNNKKFKDFLNFYKSYKIQLQSLIHQTSLKQYP